MKGVQNEPGRKAFLLRRFIICFINVGGFLQEGQRKQDPEIATVFQVLCNKVNCGWKMYLCVEPGGNYWASARNLSDSLAEPINNSIPYNVHVCPQIFL